MSNPELCLEGKSVGKNGVKGPCWPGHIYIGPEPGVRGSCIKKTKLCKKKRGKGTNCKSKITCDLEEQSSSGKKTIDKTAYKKCIKDATRKFNNNERNLCPEGYCTAKHTFEVYPSAYANGYATQVCKGDKPDAFGKVKANDEYMRKLYIKKQQEGKSLDNLQRWYREQWVNLCEKDPKGPGGFAVCGSGKGVDNPEDYPYCRAYYKLDGTGVVTVEELKETLTSQEFNNLVKHMCKKKRSLEQGVDGKPTRIKLPAKIYKKIKAARQSGGFSSNWMAKNNRLYFVNN